MIACTKGGKDKRSYYRQRGRWALSFIKKSFLASLLAYFQ